MPPAVAGVLTRRLMRPDTVLFTSYIVHALLAATYSAAFFGFWRLYDRRYLRDWSYAWGLFAIHAMAAGTSYWLALVLRLPPNAWPRLVAPAITMLSGFAYVVMLTRGVGAAAGRALLSPSQLRRWLGTLAVVSIVLVVFSSSAPVTRDARVFLRVTVLMATMGVLAIYSGLIAWRAGGTQEWFGLRLMGGVLGGFGVKQVLNGVLLLLPATYLEVGPWLTVIDVLFVPVVGSSMVVSLLVIERARAGASASETDRAQAELASSEARFRSIIDGAADVILSMSPAGVIEFASPSTSRLLGWPPDEVVGARAFEFVHPADTADTQRALQRVLEGTDDVPALEVRLRAADGSWKRVEVLGTLGRSPGGAPMIVINARDLSERVELESRLLQAQKLESIGQLAGGVAHDFNNILTSILGHVSMARLGAPRDPQLHAELDDIQRSADRAAELTRQLLAFARRQVIEPKVLDLNELVDGMRRLMSRVIGEHIALTTDLSGQLWPIKADPAQLEQAIVNLAINARDAMPGGGRLRLATANVNVSVSEAQAHGLSVGGEFVRLVVHDSGLGMDEATRARVFEPFFTTKGLSGGTGLGLAMVHGVVAQSGGGIAVFSAPGAGARFSILLPHHVGPVEVEPATVAPRVVTPERSATILLVEDEPQVRAVASRVLRSGGFSVIEAANGSEGVEKSANFAGRIDLVLSDLVMPMMSGPMMWATIKRSRPGARIVFMSGFSADTLPDGGTLPSNASFIDKPFTVEALLAKVRSELSAG